jgi:uncharacterized protein
MADSAQVAVVRRLYEARGNPEIILQVLAPNVRWEVVEGFPYSGVYVGLDDVLRNFFGRLFEDFESFVAVGSEFFESGDHVIALGTYTGRAKATGKEFTARFAHVWTESFGCNNAPIPFRLFVHWLGRNPPNQRLKLTGGAILVFCASTSLQAAPAA